ncbi:lipase member J-like [Ixodes scapularis]
MLVYQTIYPHRWQDGGVCSGRTCKRLPTEAPPEHKKKVQNFLPCKSQHQGACDLSSANGGAYSDILLNHHHPTRLPNHLGHGPDTHTLTPIESRYPVYLSHLPAGTSIKNMIHLSQLVNSKNAQKYDYGPEGNREKYGQSDPPHYRLDNVANDIGIFWSRGDKFVPPEDVDELIRELGPRVKMKHFVDDPEYRHFHFGVGTVNHEAWHEELLEFLGRYSDPVRSMLLPALLKPQPRC